MPIGTDWSFRILTAISFTAPFGRKCLLRPMVINLSISLSSGNANQWPWFRSWRSRAPLPAGGAFVFPLAISAVRLFLPKVSRGRFLAGSRDLPANANGDILKSDEDEEWSPGHQDPPENSMVYKIAWLTT